MNQEKFIPRILVLLLLSGSVLSAWSQTVSVKPSLVAGDVVSIETAKIVMQTKDGSLNVALTDKTEFKRVPPDSTEKLKAAVPSSPAEIGTGDKVVVSGILSDDK